ncbi:MAG: LysR family transcriptional regulator [Clostridium sp.]|nr:LysR family transcriptional regulator [Clostridium sp.]MDY5483810.1 LysR family transcriptional regulator [Clostridium sp.]
MNFLNLHYFAITAEELSFTKAAKRLFITQQSLSNHISRLENEFGVTLFNRTQPMTLTEAGQALYQSSQALLYQKQQIEKNMQDLRDFRRGELTIGISTSRGAVMLPEILPEFHSTFPQVQLKLVDGTTKQITKALYDGQTDLNISFAVNDPEHVQEHLLHTEHLVCVIPNALLSTCFPPDAPHPMSGTMQDFRLFASCPFIRMPQRVWLGDVFERCCREHDVTPEIVVETTSMATLVSLCASGMGAIVLPEVFVGGRALLGTPADWQAAVSIYPLDYADGSQPITISYLRGNYLSRAAQEFIRMARKKFTY